MSGRPYDPEEISRLTDAYIEHDATHQVPEATIIHEATFEHHKGFFHEAQVALSALGMIMTKAGRQELGIRRGARIEHREQVLRFVGDKMLNPDVNVKDPRRISPWGIHQHYIDDDPSKPNNHRPVFRSEKRAVSRMSIIQEKILRNHNNANWLSRSYGPILHRERYDLTSAERIAMGRISRRIARKENAAGQLEVKFHKIQHAQDLRARMAKRRPF